MACEPGGPKRLSCFARVWSAVSCPRCEPQFFHQRPSFFRGLELQLDGSAFGVAEFADQLDLRQLLTDLGEDGDGSATAEALFYWSYRALGEPERRLLTANLERARALPSGNGRYVIEGLPDAVVPKPWL